MLHEALGEAKQILTDEQLERFVEIIREDAVWYDFFYTELTTGLRRGEICGLQWRDFDADDGRLKICRAVHEERGGKLTTWDTKTSAGARTITLPPSTVELLRERKKSALTEWIFPHPWKPEQPTHPSTAYDRLKALLKRAELPDIRFHGLHHTFATHALASGVDVKTLSGILGHTRSAFAQDTYSLEASHLVFHPRKLRFLLSFEFSLTQLPQKQRNILDLLLKSISEFLHLHGHLHDHLIILRLPLLFYPSLILRM